MVQYNYSKYTIAQNPQRTVRESYSLAAGQTVSGWSSYSQTGNKFTTAGGYVSYMTPSEMKTIYEITNDGLWLYQYSASNSSTIQLTVYEAKTVEGQGAYVGNVIAENGTYPSNGKHTDGYWYVRGSLYNPPPTNTAPTVPNNLKIVGDFRPGGTITASWSASTDREGNSISYTGRFYWHKGSQTDMTNPWGATGTYTTAIIPNDNAIDKVSFYVFASDGSSTSGQANSPTYIVTNNKTPTINLTTIDGRTFYENETFLISGTATDADVGNVVNVKYQINSEPVRAIETKISTGADISFNRTLTLKNSRLLDGTTPVTEVLADSSQHVLKVWAEDDQGGKSPEQIRTFYVVANRAPVINVDNIADQSGMVNADTIRITGRANDPDGNEITAKYRINTGALIDLPLNNGEWIVTLPIKQLVDGNNNITIEVTDSYNFKSTKTIRLRKDFRATELPESVQRYKIEPPRGSAKGILLWVQREESQTVEASISMVDSGEQESYTPMNLSVTAPVGNGMVEDEFIYEADTARASIHLKLNITGSGSVALISGVLT